MAEYTNWHPVAAPDADGVNCMQMLSGTFYDGLWMTYACQDSYVNTHALCQLKYENILWCMYTAHGINVLEFIFSLSYK